MAELPIKYLKNYSQPSPSGVPTGLTMPTIVATNFEIKPALLTMIQNNQFSLRDKAQKWLNDINVTEWNEIAQAFLIEYFPPNRTDDFIDKMMGFKQEYGESLKDAWERFKDLQRACPHHGLEKWFLIKRFYNGLDPETMGNVDNAICGVFLDKRVDDAYAFLANLVANHFNNPRAPKKGGKLEVEAYYLLSSQLVALTQEIYSLKTSQSSNPPMSINALSSMAPMNNLVCEVCGVQGHLGNECSYNFQNSQNFQMEQTNVFQQRQQYNPYSNTYNPGWRDHLNFSNRNNNAQNLPIPNQQQQYQQSYQSSQQQQYKPSQGPMNPPGFQKPPQNYAPQASEAAHPDQTNEMLKLLMQEIKDRKTDKNGTEGSKKADIEKIVNAPSLFVPKLPFPSRMNRTKVDQQFGKFMTLVKNLETIPFTDLISQVPSYAKFLKDILTKKRSFGEVETVAFTEECSVVL
ncbi:uncharacterized protein LOC141695630 [Apium graveolens]|uniref:uncharacterized protein LOC141695630 n=1 Tax=Apium graveolens TaxID=4045 RepID=UPI003D7BBE6F